MDMLPKIITVINKTSKTITDNSGTLSPESIIKHKMDNKKDIIRTIPKFFKRLIYRCLTKKLLLKIQIIQYNITL